MSEWAALLQTFGLGTLILLFLGLCLWKTAPWFGREVVKALVDKYLELLDTVIAEMRKGEAVRSTLLDLMTRQAAAVDRVVEAVDRLCDVLDRQARQ